MENLTQYVKENATVVYNEYDFYFYATIEINGETFTDMGTDKYLAINNLLEYIKNNI